MGSERANQGARSVYGSDVYSAFVDPGGRALPRLMAQCAAVGQVAGIQVQSETRRSGPMPPVASQLHFLVECSIDAVENVRKALADALAAFHVEAGHYARAAEGLRDSPAAGAPSMPQHAVRGKAW